MMLIQVIQDSALLVTDGAFFPSSEVKEVVHKSKSEHSTER
jgi:hypothetical protein